MWLLHSQIVFLGNNCHQLIIGCVAVLHAININCGDWGNKKYAWDCLEDYANKKIALSIVLSNMTFLIYPFTKNGRYMYTKHSRAQVPFRILHDIPKSFVE